MKCPACEDVTLVMADRQGIEVDYCPRCRGVWLDRGELDKIIDRSVAVAEAPRQRVSDPRYRDSDEDDYRGYGRKRKRGFLGELFEFD